MESEDNELRGLLNDIAVRLQDFPKELEKKAAAIHQTGKDPELAEKLIKGADAMRDSGNLYITWARHFTALSEGTSDAADDEDESEDFGW